TGTGSGSYSGTSTQVTITMNGPITEQANFIELFQVTFMENGLPSGTTWYVNLSNGQSYSSSNNTITFNEPNGTYTFSVGVISGYTANPSSGTITVNGGNVNQGITFTQNGTKLSTITFIESGLPSGTKWYVNLSNGQSFSSTSGTITFSEPNGTYSYTIATVNKNYAPAQSIGTFTVNGANVSMEITFNLVTYKITFTENGLPSGTTWSVTLNGVIHNSSTNMIIFSEPNGSYSYTIMTPINGSTGTRYITLSSLGTTIVNGANATIDVSYETQYYLTMLASPENGGSVSPTGG
ncbi:MAG: hypothetical protein ACP5TW_06370, partial [Thermoplasmata archaeon]